MIVHPIGMMRANAAAAGLNFVDDFTGYALDALLRDQAPYTSGGASQSTIIADSGGVRVARQPGGVAILNYTASAVAADREVSVTVKTLGQQDYIGVYLSYIDADNYTWMTIGATGSFGFLQKVAGANGVLHTAASSASAGDKFTLSRVGTSLTLKQNGVQVGPTATLAAEGASTVRLHLRDAASPSSTWEISKFEVKDL